MGFQPVLGLLMLAFGTMAIAAGVVAVTDITASRAGKDMSTQRVGAAALDGAHGLLVAGQQVWGIFSAIGWSVLAEDVS